MNRLFFQKWDYTGFITIAQEYQGFLARKLENANVDCFLGLMIDRWNPAGSIHFLLTSHVDGYNHMKQAKNSILPYHLSFALVIQMLTILSIWCIRLLTQSWFIMTNSMKPCIIVPLKIVDAFRIIDKDTCFKPFKPVFQSLCCSISHIKYFICFVDFQTE